MNGAVIGQTTRLYGAVSVKQTNNVSRSALVGMASSGMSTAFFSKRFQFIIRKRTVVRVRPRVVK